MRWTEVNDVGIVTEYYYWPADDTSEENQLFLDHGWPQVIETVGSKTADEGEISYILYVICNIQHTPYVN